jgi:hypothetical protein
MRTPQNDVEIYLLGFLVAAIVIGAIVYVLLQFDKKALEARRKFELKPGGKEGGADLSGGRDVSAALGVQQSTGLKIVREKERGDSEERRARDVF